MTTSTPSDAEVVGASAQGKPAWINCDERLPEDRKAVLVWESTNQNRFTAVWEPGSVYRESGWYHFGTFDALIDGVTHWVPLDAIMSPPSTRPENVLQESENGDTAQGKPEAQPEETGIARVHRMALEDIAAMDYDCGTNGEQAGRIATNALKGKPEVAAQPVASLWSYVVYDSGGDRGNAVHYTTEPDVFRRAGYKLTAYAKVES